MTYQHALRYLTASDAASRGNTRPLLRAYVSQTKATPPLFIRFTANKLGHTAALFLRNVLTQAGVGYLHWIDDVRVEPKLRFWQGNKPVTPPLMARLAGELHDMEIATPDVTLSDAERSAALLCRLAAKEECRVILFESTQDAPLLPAFCAIYPRLNALVVLSDKSDTIPESVRTNVRLVISPTYGPAFYHRISDICAASNIRLEIIKKSRRSAITLGTQILSYGKFPDCRISSGSHLCADAAFLAMECVQALDRLRVSIPAEAVQNGLNRTDLSHGLHLRCIHPLMLSDGVANDEELRMTLSDLDELSAHFPSPRRLWLDDALSDTPPPLSSFFDEVCRTRQEFSLSEDGTTFVIGSTEFIESFLKNARRKPKKA